MKWMLNMILAFTLSSTIQSAGATMDTWQFWASIALVCGMVVVQYIPHKEG